MAETTLNHTTDEAYSKLKEQLAQRKCRITDEEPPSKISAIQGSLWGITAKSAQKTMNFTLEDHMSGTRIKTKSALTSGYVILTSAGIAFSVALLIVCLWIALDLQAYTSTGAAGFWGWLAQTRGFFDPDKAILLTRLSWFLTAFLAATLIVETIVVARVVTGIEATAEEVFETLGQQK